MASASTIKLGALGSAAQLFARRAAVRVHGMFASAAATIKQRRNSGRSADASFDIRRGENVGIIGLNGAGKSTLLKVLSQIVTPTTGNAAIIGRLGALLEVGTGFHQELTGRENVFLYGSILGMTPQGSRPASSTPIVEFSEIAEFIDTPVKRYSERHVCAPRLCRRRPPRSRYPAAG